MIRLRYGVVCIGTLILMGNSPAAVARFGGQPVGHGVEPVRRSLLSRADADAAQRMSRVLPGLDLTNLVAGFRGRPLILSPGELLSATARKSAAIRVIFEETSVRARLNKFDGLFVPRGVDYDPDRNLLAIAAVSQVLVLDGATGTVTVLLSPETDRQRFGFANDVLFDGNGGLVIADQGDEASGRRPRDGALWRYDLETGGFVPLGARRRLRNPKLLARHFDGTIYFVDGEAGPRITPGLEFRYDTVYRLAGSVLDKAKRFYNAAGIQATAFDIGPDGRFWFGNVSEIVTLQDNVLSVPCALPAPFQFVTGIAVGSDDAAYVLDGASVVAGKRTLYEVDQACAATVQLEGGKLTGARGLAQVAAVEQ